MKEFTNYTINEIETEIKLNRWISLNDVVFISIYMLFIYIFKSFVALELRPFYIGFSFLIAIYLSLKNQDNVSRRNYQSILLFLSRDITVYRHYNSED